MPQQRPGAAARHYHAISKYRHSGESTDDDSILMGHPPDLGLAMGEQDPALEPRPFKVYANLTPEPIPASPLVAGIPALRALDQPQGDEAESAPLDANLLGTILLRTAGLLKTSTTAWGKTIHFRAAGCTGARYHLELYVVTGDLQGLDAGVYHYDPFSHGLHTLRQGDFRAALVAATGDHPAAAEAPALLVCTSEFWRNAWRYQERTWRHAFWDLGTLATNLLGLSASAGLPATVLMGFADDDVARLVGVDGEREAPLAIFALGAGSRVDPALPDVPSLDLRVEPTSAREIAFPEIQRAQRASALVSGDEAAAWRERPLRREPRPVDEGALTFLTPLPDEDIPDESIEQVITRRRSNRHYDTAQSLPFAVFSTVLMRTTAPAPVDALDPAAPSLVDLYLIVHDVEGLTPGAYLFHRDRVAVELLEAGDFRDDSVRLACIQPYAGDAHVDAYVLADFDPILERYGDRGYRLAQFEGALLGGRLQLAAHALRLGAVGSTSFDDEVIDFFSPHAAGKDFLFVAVFGVRRRPTESETRQATKFLNRDRE
jgi:SagB-type dehydrogenase family enzyme